MQLLVIQWLTVSQKICSLWLAFLSKFWTRSLGERWEMCHLKLWWLADGRKRNNYVFFFFFFLSGESFNSLRLPQRFSPFVQLNESLLEKIIVLQIFSKHMAEYLGSSSLVSICETSWILWWIICLSAWSPRLHICSYRLLRSKLFNLQL